MDQHGSIAKTISSDRFYGVAAPRPSAALAKHSASTQRLSPLRAQKETAISGRDMRYISAASQSAGALLKSSKDFVVNNDRRSKENSNAELKPAKMKQPFRGDASDVRPVPVWTGSDKEAARQKLVFKKESALNKLFYSEVLLNDVLDYMKLENGMTLENAARVKWEEIIWLTDQLIAFGRACPSLAGAPQSLYERFYKAEPKPRCNQAQFLTVMRRVYGFETANLDSVCDGVALQHLSVLFNCLDICESVFAQPSGKADWKSLIFATKVTSDAFVNIRQQLEWGFALYTSEGAFDRTLSGCISRVDVQSLVSVMAGNYQQVRELKERAHQGLCMITASDEGKVKADRGKLNFKEFTAFLDTPSMQGLFRAAPSVLYCCIMETSYDATLRQRLIDVRKEHYNNSRAAMLRHIHKLRRQFEVFSIMVDNMRTRKWLRDTMGNLAADWAFFASTLTFQKLQDHAMRSSAACNIQRVYRGACDRWFVAMLRGDHRSARTLQSYMRMWICTARLRMERRRRHLHASKVQGLVRGKAARIKARRMLLVLFTAEHHAIVAQRRAWMKTRRNQAARFVQRVRRGNLGRTRARDKRGVKDAENEVQSVMAGMQKAFSKNLDIYVHQVTAFYANKRRRALDHAKEVTKAWYDSLACLRLRRRRKFEEDHQNALESRKGQQQKEFDRLKKWNEVWEDKKKNAMNRERENMIRILRKPERGTFERERQRLLRKALKVTSAAVMKREAAKGYTLELAEADELAQEEVFAEEEEKAVTKIVAEWEEAEKEYQLQIAQENAVADARAAKLEQLDKIHCAEVFVAQVRGFRARRHARQLCALRYRKKFDTGLRRPFYFDTRTGDSQWELPNKHIMGEHDLDFDDEWLLLEDEKFEGRFFMYNPRTQEQSWDAPDGALAKPEDGVGGRALNAGRAADEETASAPALDWRSNWQKLHPTVQGYCVGEGHLRLKLELHMLRVGDGFSHEELAEHMFYEADADKNDFLDWLEIASMMEVLYGAPLDDAHLYHVVCQMDPQSATRKHKVSKQAAVSGMLGEAVRADLYTSPIEVRSARVSLRHFMEWLRFPPEKVAVQDAKFLASLPRLVQPQPEDERAYELLLAVRRSLGCRFGFNLSYTSVREFGKLVEKAMDVHAAGELAIHGPNYTQGDHPDPRDPHGVALRALRAQRSTGGFDVALRASPAARHAHTPCHSNPNHHITGRFRPGPRHALKETEHGDGVAEAAERPPDSARAARVAEAKASHADMVAQADEAAKAKAELLGHEFVSHHERHGGGAAEAGGGSGSDSEDEDSDIPEEDDVPVGGVAPGVEELELELEGRATFARAALLKSLGLPAIKPGSEYAHASDGGGRLTVNRWFPLEGDELPEDEKAEKMATLNEAAELAKVAAQDERHEIEDGEDDGADVDPEEKYDEGADEDAEKAGRRAMDEEGTAEAMEEARDAAEARNASRKGQYELRVAKAGRVVRRRRRKEMQHFAAYRVLKPLKLHEVHGGVVLECRPPDKKAQKAAAKQAKADEVANKAEVAAGGRGRKVDKPPPEWWVSQHLDQALVLPAVPADQLQYIAWRDHNGDLTRTTGGVRLRLLCPDCQGMMKTLDALKAKLGKRIVQVHNRFRDPSALGRRDLSLYVEVSVKDGTCDEEGKDLESSYVCEINIQITEMEASQRHEDSVMRPLVKQVMLKNIRYKNLPVMAAFLTDCIADLVPLDVVECL
jgi:hypothetical protein